MVEVDSREAWRADESSGWSRRDRRPRRDRRARHDRPVVRSTLTGCLYLALSLVAILPIFSHGIARESGCGCWDFAQQQWFLGWDAHALVQGHGFFVSSALNAPYGVNTLWNTSMLLPGTVLAPVTLLWGPIVTFNVLIIAGFAGSALSMYLVLGRWVQGWAGRFAAGLLYGFSPFAVGHALGGHVNLVMGWLPPVILLAFDEVLIRQNRSSRWAGIVLGLLLALQLFITEEVVAECGVLFIAAVIVLAAKFPAEFRLRRARAVSALGWTAAVFVALCGYPLYIQLTGPAHIHGGAQSATSLNFFSADLLGFIIPTGNQQFVPGFVTHFTQTFVGGYLPESSAYVGIPLLLLVIVSGIALRRDRRVATFTWLFWIALVLSLGPNLVVDARRTAVPLPFAVLRHLPLFSSEISARFAQFVILFGAVILAMTADAIVAQDLLRPRSGPRHARRVSSVRSKLAAGLIVIACLVPMVPRWPYQMNYDSVPTLFTSKAFRSVPVGTTLLAYPFPSATTAQIMVFQAYTNFRFNLVGGYAVVPDAHGGGSLTPISSVMNATLSAFDDPSSRQPRVTPALIRAIKHEMCASGVGALLVEASAPGSSKVVPLFSQLAGTTPIVGQGYVLWPAVHGCA